MIRTGSQYLDTIRDGREVYINGGLVMDVRVAEDRRILLAFARDLLSSDYAGHRPIFQLFARSPPFAHLAAAYRNSNWTGPLDFVRKAAALSDRVMQTTGA